MKKIFFITFLLGTINLFSNVDNNEILKKYSIKFDDITVIAFLDPINCIKCKLNIDQMIQYLMTHVQKKKVSVIGFMRINRKVEFDYFKKRVDWKYPIYMIDKEFISKIGIKNNMDFILLSGNRNIIYQNNLSEIANIQKECKKVVDIINSNN